MYTTHTSFTRQTPAVDSLAVLFAKPKELQIERLALVDPGPDDVVVDTYWTGISTGTERLLWTGDMPAFPGMGYPLVPGYESVGEIVEAGPNSGRTIGEHVFVPGSHSFRDARALFGGAASRLIVPGSRAVPVDHTLGDRAVLLALAATAWHAIAGHPMPQLIVGHGVLGRLLARLAVLQGKAPVTVWETNAQRHAGAHGYRVCTPDDDPRRDYTTILDVSGDSTILDLLVPRLARNGEVVLAGFYHNPVAFNFAPAFQRELRLRVAAEWRPTDLQAVTRLVADSALSLDGLITHQERAPNAAAAYATAFGDAACLKMVLDWRDCA